jgi:hypothetical protein
MKRGLSIAAVILMSLALSACSSLSASSNFEATLSAETDEYCSPFGDSGLETCIVSMNIKNITDIPQRITGTIYGYADGKVYKASNWLTNSIDFYEDTLNPGETKGSVIAFDIPKGSTLTKVFVGPTSDPNDAIMTLELNLLAQDNEGGGENNSAASDYVDCYSLIGDYDNEPISLRASEGCELAQNALEDGLIVLDEQDTYSDILIFCQSNIPSELVDDPNADGDEVWAATDFSVGCTNFLYDAYRDKFGDAIPQE